MPGVIELAAASGSFDPDWPPAADDAEAIARISATRLGPPAAFHRAGRSSAAISTLPAWTSSTRLSAIGRASRPKGGFETSAPASSRDPRQRMSIARVDRREQEPRIGWVCSWEKVGAGADETETVEQRRVSGPWVIERRWNGQPSTP